MRQGQLVQLARVIPVRVAPTGFSTARAGSLVTGNDIYRKPAKAEVLAFARG